MKYLVLALIIFVVYKFFLQPTLPASPPKDPIKSGEEDDDYIDYEEID